MTGRPTATERAAIKAGYAALLQSESPNSNIVETVVFGLGDRQMLMSPETADELRQLRDRVAELEAELRIGAPWTCPTCSKENTRDVCAVCETDRPETADEWVRCSGLRCPNAERYARAAERGWAPAHMDTWLCPKCASIVPPPVESLGSVIADRIRVIDDVEAVTVDDGSTLTVQVRPRDLDGWNWWLGRFQVPVASITCRGLVTTAKGTAPGGVTVNIVGHGIAALQAAAVSYITQRGGESR